MLNKEAQHRYKRASIQVFMNAQMLEWLNSSQSLLVTALLSGKVGIIVSSSNGRVPTQKLINSCKTGWKMIFSIR